MEGLGLEHRSSRVHNHHARTGSQGACSEAGGVQECSSRFRFCLSDLVSDFLLCTLVTWLPNRNRAHEKPGRVWVISPRYAAIQPAPNITEQTGVSLGGPEAPSMPSHFMAKRISPQVKEDKHKRLPGCLAKHGNYRLGEGTRSFFYFFHYQQVLPHLYFLLIKVMEFNLKSLLLCLEMLFIYKKYSQNSFRFKDVSLHSSLNY